ncbi:hypothetical protein [Caloranaerobacter azorensis]|uniref:Uncharacterized protein n=1 Tax=Caloranaerobacter azorensis TaxID=116090 RepID=A0A6P1YG95_9FIRM|nr:hypothetical protein [Caloranaerobacter azorensis]QIB27215.1 hypothetical protein G3A45_07915 [Caloranaerobacter azorensis]
MHVVESTYSKNQVIRGQVFGRNFQYRPKSDREVIKETKRTVRKFVKENPNEASNIANAIRGVAGFVVGHGTNKIIGKIAPAANKVANKIINGPIGAATASVATGMISDERVINSVAIPLNVNGERTAKRMLKEYVKLTSDKKEKDYSAEYLSRKTSITDLARAAKKISKYLLNKRKLKH